MGARTVVRDLAFPECPRWHGGRLWFSDTHEGRVHAVDVDSGADEIVTELPGAVGGLGFLPDGRLLAVDPYGRRVMRRENDGSLTVHADLSDVVANTCNDMAVDHRGRAYVGNFGFDILAGAAPAAADLVLARPDGSVAVVAEGLWFPNGTIVTPDGSTLIISELRANLLTAFTIEADGALSGRRRWAVLEGFVADGTCLDESGAVWCASPSTREVVRVREGGEVLERVAFDAPVHACVLGGNDRRTLLACVGGNHVEAEAVRQRLGRIEAVTVDVPGAGIP